MKLLNRHQLRIMEELRADGCSLSRLAVLLKTDSVVPDLRAMAAAGIPLVIGSAEARLADENLLLNRGRIERLLDCASRRILGAGGLRVLMSVSSTNDEIKKCPAPCVLLAEQQEQGKGRYGRGWSSPFAAGIYLSFKERREQRNTDGLSLAVGVAVARVLAPLPISLKWPNDLMTADGKLGGILIEISDPDLIIGLGINYAERAGRSSLRRLWSHHGQHPWSRDRLTARLIDRLLSAVTLFRTRGFAPFYSDWRERDMLKGKRVQIGNGAVISGLCQGVDERGALLVRVEGEIKRVMSGTLNP